MEILVFNRRSSNFLSRRPTSTASFTFTSSGRLPSSSPPPAVVNPAFSFSSIGDRTSEELRSTWLLRSNLLLSPSLNGRLLSPLEALSLSNGNLSALVALSFSVSIFSSSMNTITALFDCRC
ncbi:hypothetical protein LWI29_024341 [Acer saccharum]|uniref:Uncharacterized protein n=1 Tax=Acer saccharum TaxID=4024 RepID=A0AA39S4D7_ACESA|nr:hypothetical protein LWI29_024341 [Acer saccharum]